MNDISKLAAKACQKAYQDNIESGLPVTVAKGDTLVEMQRMPDGTLKETVLKELPPLQKPKRRIVTFG